MDDDEETKNMYTWLVGNKIHCIKYHNRICKNYHNDNNSYQAYLYLSQDRETLNITNRIPIKNEKFILSSDKEIVELAKKEELKKRM